MYHARRAWHVTVKCHTWDSEEQGLIMSMHTLNELAIFRARLLRDQRQIDRSVAEASISQLNETIISRPATTPDEGIAKLELARDIAAAKGKTKIVKLIEGALLVLRH
jgi:hypothetical protein